ncbi:MAG: tRNA (adenosine(37)-N6)-threonylcarbamoyltransferase complex dimerization subunit type 1 TsaB [Micrococcaceae bacterium]
MPTAILALDSSATASVALIRDGSVVAFAESESTQHHAEVLTPLVTRVLAEAGLDPADVDSGAEPGAGISHLAVGVGPGPFTGLRAGIVTAQSLGFAWDRPVVGVLSLDALAYRAAEDAWRRGIEEFVVATNARRREVYWAHYATVGGQFQRLHGPFVSAADDVTVLPVYGTGAGLYPEQLRAVEGFATAVPRARELGLVAELGLRRGRGLEAPVPQYLRESDAKIPASLAPRS